MIIKNYIIIILALVFLLKRIGILKKEFNVNVFFLFTNLSIFIACIYYIGTLFMKENTILLYFKLNLVGYMFIVALIYNLVLVPQAKKDKLKHDYYSIYDIIAHIILPLLVLLDWLFFTNNIKINLINVLFSLIIPLFYLFLVLFKGIKKLGKPFVHSNNYYPYFFLDIDKLGKRMVLKNIVFLLIFFIFINAIFLLLNNYMLI